MAKIAVTPTIVFTELVIFGKRVSLQKVKRFIYIL